MSQVKNHHLPFHLMLVRVLFILSPMKMISSLRTRLTALTLLLTLLQVIATQSALPNNPIILHLILGGVTIMVAYQKSYLLTIRLICILLVVATS